jgi:hypothetical protein
MVATAGLLAAVGGAAAYLVYNTLKSTFIYDNFDQLPEAVNKHFRVEMDILENRFYKNIKKNIEQKSIFDVKFQIDGMKITIRATHRNNKSPTKGMFADDGNKLIQDIMVGVVRNYVKKGDKLFEDAGKVYETVAKAKILIAQKTKQIKATALEIDRIELTQALAKKPKKDTKPVENVKKALQEVEEAKKAVEQCENTYKDITAKVDELANLEKIASDAITQLKQFGLNRVNPITQQLKQIKIFSKSAEKATQELKKSVDTVVTALQTVLLSSTDYMKIQEELVQEEKKKQQQLAKRLAQQKKQLATQDPEPPVVPQAQPAQGAPQPPAAQAVQEQRAVPLSQDDQDEQGRGGEFRVVGGVSTREPIFSVPLPESIISPTYVPDVLELAMRRDFMENLKNMIQHPYNATTHPILAPLKNEESAAGTMKIPHDINPFALRGNIVFIDYMNMVGDDKTISFEIKLGNLSDKGFLSNGPIQWARDAIKSQQIDWVFIITQGKDAEYVLNTMKIGSTNVVILHAPCTIDGVTTCSLHHGKNEVDDYYLLYFVHYLAEYRQFTKKRIRYVKAKDKERLSTFLEQQKLHILSNDNYKFANKTNWGKQNVNKVELRLGAGGGGLAVIGNALRLQPR